MKRWQHNLQYYFHFHYPQNYNIFILSSINLGQHFNLCCLRCHCIRYELQRLCLNPVNTFYCWVRQIKLWYLWYAFNLSIKISNIKLFPSSHQFSFYHLVILISVVKVCIYSNRWHILYSIFSIDCLFWEDKYKYTIYATRR